MAKLSQIGIQQAEEVSKDKRLTSADIILSSPYTRALQTAAIISRNTGIPIEVKTDLIEWMPDITFSYDGPTHFSEVEAEIQKDKGEWNNKCKYHWESLSMVGERSFHAIKKYLNFKKVIVVAHGILIRQFVYYE